MRRGSSPPLDRFTSILRIVTLTVIIGGLLVTVLMSGTSASAQSSESVVWERYDVTVDLIDDGTLHVTERQVVRFSGGSFSSGYADIPMGRIDEIDNVEVSEVTAQGTIPYQEATRRTTYVKPQEYRWDSYGAYTSIVWGFDRTTNATRTFIIEYDAIGALRVYPNNLPTVQQLWWTAISKDVTDIAPVRAASVTINLPSAVDPADVVVSVDDETIPPEERAAYTVNGQSWTWSKEGLSEGDEFIVRLEFPPLVQASAPLWQQADDDRRRKEEEAAEQRALLNSMFFGMGLLGIVGGCLAIYGLWYFRGRDPHTGLMADFLPQPPDDLPPGAAGALVDEVVHQRDIVATLVDLSRRGVIAMNLASPSSFSGDVDVTLVDASKPIAPFEKEALNALFSYRLDSGSTAKLWQASSKFGEAAPRIRSLMYDELVRRSYFDGSPEETRDNWRNRALRAIIWLPIAGLFIWWIFFQDVSWFWLPIAVLVILSIAIYLISGSLPRKTAAGAQAAAKWEAFRRYLDRIDDYEQVADQRQLFDTYLPYAVAFGLEHSWVNAFARTDTPAPHWYAPVWTGSPVGDLDPNPVPRRLRQSAPYDWPTTVGQSWWDVTGADRHAEPQGGRNDSGFGLLDWQGTSDHASRALSRASDGMLKMFSTAGNALSSMAEAAAESDWGNSGSGSRRSSSSRSRRSFGGGGRRGGSSGGGRRGFR